MPPSVSISTSPAPAGTVIVADSPGTGAYPSDDSSSPSEPVPAAVTSAGPPPGGPAGPSAPLQPMVTTASTAPTTRATLLLGIMGLNEKGVRSLANAEPE